MHDSMTPNPFGTDPGQPAAPARSRTGLIIGIGTAVVVLLALLGGGAVLLTGRSASTASTASVQAAGIAAQSSDPTASSPVLPRVSVDQPVGADEVTPTPAGAAAAASSGSGANASPAPAPVPAPAPAPAPKPTTPPPAPKPASPAPVITSFTTPDTIDCHNGNSQTFTASWTTTHATKVTISIDGPGIYKTYPANGSDSLPFSCSSAHSFTLTAFGQDGKTVTKTITLQPRNVQVPSSGDDE